MLTVFLTHVRLLLFFFSCHRFLSYPNVYHPKVVRAVQTVIQASRNGSKPRRRQHSRTTRCVHGHATIITITIDAKSRNTIKSRTSSNRLRCIVAVIWVIKSVITRICGRRRTAIIHVRVCISHSTRRRHRRKVTKRKRRWPFSVRRPLPAMKLPSPPRATATIRRHCRQPSSSTRPNAVHSTRTRSMLCHLPPKLYAVSQKSTFYRASIGIRNRRKHNSTRWDFHRRPSTWTRALHRQLLPDHWIN